MLLDENSSTISCGCSQESKFELQSFLFANAVIILISPPRFIEKLAFETRDIVSNIHGGGSPEAHRMTLLRDTDLEPKKAFARRLAGIEERE